MKIWKKYKELDSKVSDELNLNKMFPNYFNKTVFRFGVFTIIIFAILALYLSDWNLMAAKVECHNPMGCDNPCYYEPSYWACSQINSTEPILPDGFSTGKDNFLVDKGWAINTSIIALTFIINHILYLWRKKHGAS